jgi:colicin import membrane protein
MDNVIEAVVVKEEVLDAIVKKENIAAPTAATLLASFAPFRGEIETALTEARGITDDTDAEQRKKARECRLTLKRIRVNVENTRKTSKEDAVRYGKAVDGMANVLKFLCEPEEKRLEAIEEAEQRREETRIACMVADRMALIQREWGNPAIYNLATMEEEAFLGVLDGLRQARIAKEEEAKKAEAARVAKEKEEAEARERQRLENERLKKEAAVRDAELKAEREAREAAEAAIRVAKQAAELELAKEREAAAKKQAEIEAKARREREEAAKKQAEVEAAAKRERDAVAKKQAEAAKALEAEAKKERDAKAAAEKAEKAAAAKAARAPDKQKLLVWLGKFQAVLGELPGLRTGEGKNALIAVMASANDLIRVTETEIEGL